MEPVSPLSSTGYRPLQLSCDDQLKALVYFHLQEFSSGRELIQALEEDDFAKECAPPKGVKRRYHWAEEDFDGRPSFWLFAECGK